MIALAADGSMSPPRSDQLLCKIRPGLLALKQFEPVYVLARWIRNFFMDILGRSKSLNDGGMPRTDELIESRDQGDAQAITPESVPYAQAGNARTRTETPISANLPEYSSPGLAVGDSSFMFDDGTHRDAWPPVELPRGAGGFWPTSLTSGVFSNDHDSDLMDFPQPDSLQYQAMYFLADLGIASSECA